MLQNIKENLFFSEINPFQFIRFVFDSTYKPIKPTANLNRPPQLGTTLAFLPNRFSLLFHTKQEDCVLLQFNLLQRNYFIDKYEIIIINIITTID